MKIFYFVVTLVFIFTVFGNDAPANTAKYSDCLYNPTTQFNVGLYKQKYPSLSETQIAHILCK